MQFVLRIPLTVILIAYLAAQLCAQESWYVPPPLDVGAYAAVTQNSGTITLASANTYGAGQLFFNSGTIYAAAPITFGVSLTQSLGSSSTAASQFTNKYDGANMTFLGTVSLFNNAMVDNRITVNNTTTFAGGWATSGTDNPYPSVVINGSPAHLTIAGPIALDKPMAIQTVTIELNGAMVDPAATLFVSSSGTLQNGVDPSLPAVGAVVVGNNDSPISFYLSGHNQTLSQIQLVDGVLSGSSNTITAISDINEEFDPNFASKVTLVPEPSTIILSVCGIGMLGLLRRRAFAKRTIARRG